MQKICFITGTRAEYGLLSPLMQAVKDDTTFDLQLIATGMHLSPEFGLTFTDIENDGFVIDEKIEMLLSADTDTGITKSTGLAIISFTDALKRLNPSWCVILGDRFEAFAAATTAFLLKIPIIHISGGDVTEGATDDALRHAITKMSYIHFTTTETYRKRVIQLGESPERVFNVGAIGIDNIKNIELYSKEWLADNLLFDLNFPFLLITYHPVTLENNSAAEQFNALLKSFEQFPELKLIFTKPNSDANGRVIIKLIDDFVKENPERATGFISLGQKRYLSLMQYAKAVVGNSSSGIVETPSFGIPTVNIGDRQKGRERAESVIDVAPNQQAIAEAITKAISPDFQAFSKEVKNVYGNGTTTHQIMQILKVKPIPQVLKKAFYDLS